VTEALPSFDADGVHAVWAKALSRRNSDPDGAIIVARTLLETICKRILDENEMNYTDEEDLPKVYAKAAKALDMAPDQHAETIRSILGGAMAVVNGIAALGDKPGDARDRGATGDRPLPRRATLAVNMAGALATFLVETHLERQTTPNDKRDVPLADPPQARVEPNRPTFDEAVAAAEAGQIQHALNYFDADEDPKSALTIKSEDNVKFIYRNGPPFTLLRREISIWRQGQSVLTWWEEHNGYYDATGADWRLDENPDNGPPPGVAELLDALEIKLPPVVVPRPPSPNVDDA
jgi:hypothetical protein